MHCQHNRRQYSVSANKRIIDVVLCWGLLASDGTFSNKHSDNVQNNIQYSNLPVIVPFRPIQAK